ncbi:MAG: sensor histidine kinase [Verrucomicrobiales bacterium]|nr:ATP-binding protein [Verrucomicrobiota bacterium JB025]
MKVPSIKRHLIVGCGLAIVVLFTLGSVSLYWSIQRYLRKELDATVLDSMEFVAAEIEYEEGQLVYDWLDERQGVPLMGKLLFFQGWSAKSGETHRSATLDGQDLPRPPAVTREPVLLDIELPNGHPARAVAVEVLPRIDDDERRWAAEHRFTHDPASDPQVLLVSHDMKPLMRTLFRIRRALVIESLAILLMVGVVVHLVIKRSLRPLQELSVDLAGRGAGTIDEQIEVPASLPAELRPQTEAFNALLARISDARKRDRDFALHASHELRTPLAGMQAILENAVSAPRDPADFIERIHRALAVLMPLSDSVSRILHLARIQSGESQLAPESCQLPEIIGEAWQSLEAAAKRKRLELRLPAAADGPGVTTDLPLLRVLINNLLDNAVRHSPDGGFIEVTCDPERLRVRNSCAGISQADINRAFDPFVQLQPGGSGGGGTGATAGIGLTLCREIVEVLGFSLQATVSADESVTFTLEFRA